MCPPPIDREAQLMITVEHLSKSYGGTLAVDDVSFTARPGAVTGFLGPNGAGKSTCMRMMVGLTPPTSGSATVLGQRYVDLPNPGRRVGVLLDAAAQHAGRTGHEVLTLGAKVMGLDPARVTELLEVVGLEPSEAERRVGTYSLGMRQRLGIAHALLGDPEVLILDEPANGLDPSGIRWMRSLLRAYADQGGTVLLSSHLLSEIEILADDLVVIGRGRIVARDTKAGLLAGSGVTVASTDNAAFARLLEAAGMSVTTRPDSLLVTAPAVEIGRIAAANAVVLTELSASSAALEDLFIDLTSADSREPGSAQSSRPNTATKEHAA